MAEREDLRRGTPRIEPRGVRIDGRVAIGSGEHDQHDVAVFHPLSGHDRVLREEAPGVLHRSIVPCHFTDDRVVLWISFNPDR